MVSGDIGIQHTLMNQITRIADERLAEQHAKKMENNTAAKEN